MILVDTSVVIDYLRTTDTKMLALFQAHDATVCGITRAEVLHGARTPDHRQQLLDILAIFGQLGIPDPLWDLVGNHLAQLRTNGVTVPFQDVVLATVAVVNDVELWARDRQFTFIQNVLSQLKLFQEPP